MLSFGLETPGLGSVKVEESVVNGYKMYTLNYPCNDQTSCTPYTASLPAGKYKFEVIGAGGGNSYKGNIGGNGGYSVGYFETIKKTNAFFFIGGKGVDGKNYNGNPVGGYNGGGRGGYDLANNYGQSGSGGGSSDIRINSKEIADRIIVAGGGGGSCESAPSSGNGGGSSGTSGSKSNPSYSQEGGPGTQVSGGSAYQSRGATSGTLFYGGAGSTAVQAWAGGGGGGGYYGGGGGSSTTDHGIGYSASGGGGSGFIGGVKSSSKYNVVASTTTYSNRGNGQIKITVFSASYDIVSYEQKIGQQPLSNLQVFICLVRPLT